MVLSVEKKRILVGETADYLGVVRGGNELAAGLESLPESQHEVPNLRKCKIIVRFIPETKQRAVSVVGAKYQCAYHETFFAVGQILKRKAYAALFAGKLD